MKYSKNIGQMFENAVFIKIFEDYKEISYWSELESEVDFIFDKTALNVTSQDEIHEREFRGLNDFKKKHRNFSSFIVSKSLEKDGIMPIIKFLKG
jgi:predicted AAA+ superfamily ATPase